MASTAPKKFAIDADTIKLLIQVLVIYGPAAYKAIADLFKKDAVTVEDIQGVLDFALQKSYDDYVAPKP